MNPVVKILMERDGMTENEAILLYRYFTTADRSIEEESFSMIDDTR